MSKATAKALFDHFQEGQQQRYAIYIRVSTEKQAEEGDSIEMQEALGRKYVEERGGVLYRIYVDPGISASKTDLEDRPGLNQLRADAKAGLFDVALAFKRNRLYRKTIHQGIIRNELKQHGVGIEYTKPGEMQDQGDDASGNLTETVLAAIAEFQSAETAEQVKAVMQNKVRNGEFTGGGIPYGYRRKDEQWSLAPEEVAVIQEIEDMYMRGMGENTLCQWLNGQTVKHFGTRQGGAATKQVRGKNRVEHWTKTQVRVIITTAFYSGYLTWTDRKTGEVIQSKGDHPVIRTEERYQELVALRKYRGEQKSPPRMYTTEYLLTGLLWCATCGTKMGSQNYTPSEVRRHHAYYRCHTKSNSPGLHRCNMPAFQKGVLEEVILAQIQQHINTINVEALEKAIAKRGQADKNEGAEELRKLAKSIEDVERRRENNMAEIEDTDDPEYKVELRERQRNLRQQLADLKERKVTLESSLVEQRDDFIAAQATHKALKAFSQTMRTAPMGTRKAYMEQVIERIDLFPDGRCDITFRIADPLADRCISGSLGNPNGLKTHTVIPGFRNLRLSFDLQDMIARECNTAMRNWSTWLRGRAKTLLDGDKVTAVAAGRLLGISGPTAWEYMTQGVIPKASNFSKIAERLGFSTEDVHKALGVTFSLETLLSCLHRPVEWSGRSYLNPTWANGH